MPLRLSRLFEATSTEEIPYLGEVLTVTWTPAGMTPALQDRFMSANGENESTKAVVEVLAGLLKGWDLLDDDGTPIPTTTERLMVLPKSFLLDVMRSLSSASSPKATSEPPSPDS
jgi:hypothetical protein